MHVPDLCSLVSSSPQVERHGPEAGHGVDKEVDFAEELCDVGDVVDDAGTRLAVHDAHEAASDPKIMIDDLGRLMFSCSQVHNRNQSRVHAST